VKRDARSSAEGGSTLRGSTRIILKENNAKREKTGQCACIDLSGKGRAENPPVKRFLEKEKKGGRLRRGQD